MQCVLFKKVFCISYYQSLMVLTHETIYSIALSIPYVLLCIVLLLLSVPAYHILCYIYVIILNKISNFWPRYAHVRCSHLFFMLINTENGAHSAPPPPIRLPPSLYICHGKIYNTVQCIYCLCTQYCRENLEKNRSLGINPRTNKAALKSTKDRVTLSIESIRLY
jgi:hypothetical protein